MKSAIQRLIEIGSPGLAEAPVGATIANYPELRTVLGLKNGFFAFESALHVFPAGETQLSYGLDEWNSAELWRNTYGDLTKGLLFFAEDIFGTQFCLKDGSVHSFDPETAELTLPLFDVSLNRGR